MKNLSIIIIVSLIVAVNYKNTCSQSDDEKNIISYYAVGNSLDGQPLIDYKNALRFFPVFRFREETKSVKFTAYIGNRIYTREAIQSEDKSFWQANLPDFRLGEAIQRLEVETKIEADSKRLEEFNKLKENLEKKLDAVEELLEDNKNKIKENIERINTSLTQYPLEDINSKVKSFKEDVDSLKHNSGEKLDKINSLISRLNEIVGNINNNPGNISGIIEKLNEISQSTAIIKEEIKSESDVSNELLKNNNELKSCFDTLKRILTNITDGEFVNSAITGIKSLIDKSLELDTLKNNLKDELVKEMSQKFVDTTLSGTLSSKIRHYNYK